MHKFQPIVSVETRGEFVAGNYALPRKQAPLDGMKCGLSWRSHTMPMEVKLSHMVLRHDLTYMVLLLLLSSH